VKQIKHLNQIVARIISADNESTKTIYRIQRSMIRAQVSLVLLNLSFQLNILGTFLPKYIGQNRLKSWIQA